MPPIHISLRAENIFHIFQIPISNSLLTTWLVMVFLILISLISYTRLSMIPGKWQLILELLIGGFYSFFKEIPYSIKNLNCNTKFALKLREATF